MGKPCFQGLPLVPIPRTAPVLLRHLLPCSYRRSCNRETPTASLRYQVPRKLLQRATHLDIPIHNTFPFSILSRFSNKIAHKCPARDTYRQALFPRLAASSYRNLALSARSGFWCVFSVTTRRICGFAGSKSNLVWPALRYSRHLPFQVP